MRDTGLLNAAPEVRLDAARDRDVAKGTNGRLWPASQAELFEWLDRCGKRERAVVTSAADADAYSRLLELAERRFGGTTV